MRISETDRIIAAAKARAAKPDLRPLRLLNPTKRGHKKRHSVNRERSREASAKAHRGANKISAYLQRRKRNAEKMRAYFAGECEDLGA